MQPNSVPQTQFFESAADIVIYGGGAGGGKSWAILAEPLRHVHRKGFFAGIFRRTTKMITDPGGLWDSAVDLYSMAGGNNREGRLDASWRNGGKIKFCHCQHEKNKKDYQGAQFGYLAFDELTHFTQSQFFYLLSRLRNNCGIKSYCRATCNPEPGWVADLLSWWINQETGYAIPERSGVVRYFYRDDGEFVWGSTREEVQEQCDDIDDPENDILSITFIPASAEDNPDLEAGYIGRLKAQSKIERARLLDCNWKMREGSIIEQETIKRFTIDPGTGDTILNYHGRHLVIPQEKFRRFATVDTAGTSREKAAERKGDPPSYTCCAVWDHFKHRDRQENFDVLILRHMFRGQVGWAELKSRIPEVLSNWSVPLVMIENAHHGQPLYGEIKGFNKKMINPMLPGMVGSSQGAKLERAIASGLLSRLEDIGLWIPDDSLNCIWVPDFLTETLAWTGLPKETADQIDVASYAAYHTKKRASWGGVPN